MKKPTPKDRIKRKKIVFSFEAIDAKEVCLVGEFNEWKEKSHPMKNDGKGICRKTLMLPEGKFEYKFVVDGQWVVDPQKERLCPNRFGTLNSIVRVIL